MADSKSSVAFVCAYTEDSSGGVVAYQLDPEGDAERILSVAEAAGIDCRLGSTVELGPGTLAAGALGASSTAVTYPCDRIGPRIYEESILESGLDNRDGRLRPSSEPGFGFTLQDGIF